MKLTLIGAGVRSPMFISSALRRAERLGIDEIALLDDDPERVRIFGAIGRSMADGAPNQVRVTATTDAQVALASTAHVVNSIRVGQEQARIADERVALDLGLLGQETTGPGGFAMALRNIPAIVDYARLSRDLSPDAWLYTFTNPAGIVTQALHDAGFDRVVGICDSGNAAQRAIARDLGVAEGEVATETYGLNHLTWTRAVYHSGEDVLPRYLADEGFLAGTTQSMFDRELRSLMGMWFNEYLYYWYYYERALAGIQAEVATRGEEIAQLTSGLMAELRRVDLDSHPGRALDLFVAYQRRRASTYMGYAYADNAGAIEAPPARYAAEDYKHIDEGYAGVMLDVIDAVETGRPIQTVLNVPNRGAIVALAPDDVVEISCDVDADGVRPVQLGHIRRSTASLISSVKTYERLTVGAVAERSRSLAIEALMAHPMVLSHSHAVALVDGYAKAHRAYVPWLA